MGEDQLGASVPEQRGATPARLRFTESRQAVIALQQATGWPIVGYVGAGVPIEILLAARVLPFRVGAWLPDEVTAAARYFERGDSEMIARFVSILLDGSHAFLDHLVIGNTPTMNVALLHFLREARRMDPAFEAPRVTLHEQFHGQDVATGAYNVDSCRRLAEAMGSLGQPVTERALREAIDRVNSMRSSLASLNSARRATPAMRSGSDFIETLASWQMNPLGPPIAAAPILCTGPRIMFSGTDITRLAHYPIIEAAGCTIVADDHDWGEAVIEGLVEAGGDPIIAIADRYARQSPRSARWPAADRIRAVVDRAVAAEVDGVLLCLSDEDHASAWDVPSLRAALTAREIGCLDPGLQPATGIDAPRILQALTQWLPTIGGRSREWMR